MLPYHQLQGVYVVLGGLLAFALWCALGRLGPRPRVLVTAAALGGAGVAALALFPSFLDLRDARGFAVIAVVFYAWGFFLPALGMSAALRKPHRDRVLAGLLCVPPALALWAMLIEPNRVQLRSERVVVAAWPEDAQPFRLVHVSDLQTVGSAPREREAVARINALEPDLIVFSGDYMAGPFWDPEPGVAAAREFLAGLRARHGVVVVPGHAEPEHLRERIFAGLPLTPLANRGHAIELADGRRVAVYGLDVEDPDPTGIPSLRGVAGGTATLVASHEPDHSADLDGLGVDLHLAGHTHGGQVVLPFFGAPLTLSELPRRYARGLHAFGDHWLNVCAGLGMEGNHAPRIRLFCPPEVCVIDLVGGDPGE